MPCLSYTVGLTLHTIEEVDSQTQFNYSTVDITTLEESPSAPMDVVLEGKDNNTCVEVTIQICLKLSLTALVLSSFLDLYFFFFLFLFLKA